MFFDVDGVFHFQQIPSGKVITDPTTGELGEPIPLVDHVIWDKTNVSYTLDTNFEEVKNCVEVLGKLHEPDEFGTSVIDGDTITVTTTKVINNYLNNSWVIGFGVTAGSPVDPPVAIATPITSIVLNDLGNNTIASIDISNTPITNGNEYYCIKLIVGATTSEVSATYLGFVQPHAIAIENNPDSPFYVGTATEYTSQTGNVVDFVQENEDFITYKGTLDDGNDEAQTYVDTIDWDELSKKTPHFDIEKYDEDLKAIAEDYLLQGYYLTDAEYDARVCLSGICAYTQDDNGNYEERYYTNGFNVVDDNNGNNTFYISVLKMTPDEFKGLLPQMGVYGEKRVEGSLEIYDGSDELNNTTITYDNEKEIFIEEIRFTGQGVG